jgi:thioredoxin-like negative regulator of GroEL
MAACYALAGKIDAARALISELPAGDRGRAAGIVFQVGHPVADAGDDESAGPMMELVLEFWPQNYMARYHAGMSAYILGQPGRAAAHLARFLEDYHQNDGWTRNAQTVLSRLEAS